MSRAQLGDLVAVLTATQLAQSNSDARRTLAQKGFRANGQVLSDDTELSSTPLLPGDYVLLRRGKTQHHLVRVEG
jgi:tyrosyl-tRNA synthetase